MGFMCGNTAEARAFVKVFTTRLMRRSDVVSVDSTFDYPVVGLHELRVYVAESATFGTVKRAIMAEVEDYRNSAVCLAEG